VKVPFPWGAIINKRDNRQEEQTGTINLKQRDGMRRQESAVHASKYQRTVRRTVSAEEVENIRYTSTIIFKMNFRFYSNLLIPKVDNDVQAFL